MLRLWLPNRVNKLPGVFIPWRRGFHLHCTSRTMATPLFPQFSRERDQAAAHALVEELMALIPKPRGRNRGIRRTTFPVDLDGNELEHPISSWHFTEFLYKKSPCPFPTLARGLFTRSMPATTEASRYDIVARGYDKFFNVGEVPKTQDAWLRANTCGPYELTVKENGCLILIAALTPNRVLVTSKHSLGTPTAEGQEANAQPTHAEVGRQWLRRHLQTAEKTEGDLAAFLHHHNATAVFELCDDEFEEHILAYQGDRRGLYLHGVNRNTPELHTWPSTLVTYVAESFGFHRTGFYTCDTYSEAMAFADRVRRDQALEGRAVEGFVVRCLLTDRDNGPDSSPHSYQDDRSHVHMYKIKYDDPYLLYREWRELTKRIIGQRPFRTQHKLSEHYAKWVRSYLAKDPSLAPAFQRNQGIIEARDQFLRYWKNQGHSLAQDLHEASASTQRKTVLVPIATIGCGKTTLANALVYLYGFGHVQNDNINVRRNSAQAFQAQVLNALVSHDVVIADRNNHLAQHRQGLTSDVSDQFLNCRFIALYWNVDQLDSEKVFRQMAVRVRQRGENHQSLTPNRTQNFEHVIWSFIRSFQPPDPDSNADHLLEDAVTLNPFAETRANLVTVVGYLHAKLGLPLPTDAKIDTAMAKALGYRPTVRKDVKSKSKSLQASYYGFKVDGLLEPALEQVAGSTLATVDTVTPAPDTALRQAFHAYFTQLKKDNRIPETHHITLVHAANLKDPANRPLFDHYEQLWAKPEQETVTVTLDYLVWNKRVLVGHVQSIVNDSGDPSAAPSTYPTPRDRLLHITLATTHDGVKPFESHTLLRQLLDRSKSLAAYHQSLQRSAPLPDTKVLPLTEPLKCKAHLHKYF